jgi:hypothetical protein
LPITKTKIITFLDNYNNMNLKIGFLSLMSLLLCSIVFGQNPEDEIKSPQMRQKVEAAKVAYITKRLNLTTKESEGFWAIHNEYESEKKALKKKYRSKQSIETMSDQEVELAINQRFELEQKLLDLDKQYFERFQSVISIRKIGMYFKAEKEFRLELLKRIREEQQNRRQPGNNRFRN